MTNEKRPSIYVDRGTIGSSDELDEYGVWVKSEPQDLSSATPDVRETETTDVDLAVPEFADLPDFDSLEDEFSGDSSDLSFDAEIDELDAPEEESRYEAAGNDFDLPEMDYAEESGEEALDFANFDETEEVSFESENEDEELEGFTEVSMEDLVGTIPAGKEKNSSGALAGESKISSARNESASDLSNQLLMKIAEELASIRTELGTLKKEFSGLKAAAPQTEEEDNFFSEEDDEKIALTGDELDNILNTADFTEEAGADATAELSEDLTLQETDVSLDDFAPDSSVSLNEVKEDSIEDPLVDLESVQKPSADDETLSIMDLDISLDEANLDKLGAETSMDDFSDFGSEDSENFDISLDDEILEAELPSEEIPQMPEETTEEAHNTEYIDVESFPEPELPSEQELLLEENFPDFAVEESEELKELLENGAEHMSFPPEPEEADYLTEDPFSAELLDAEPVEEDLPLASLEELVDFPGEELIDFSDDESIDLSEAVIDEPDLSSEVKDIPIEEPSLEDISISLDLDENSFDIATEEDENEIDPFAEEEEIELALDDIGIPEETEEEVSLEEAPLFFEPENESSEEGGDLSLIPEAFIVEADEVNIPVEETNEEIILDEEIIPEEELDIPSENFSLPDEDEAREFKSEAPPPSAANEENNIPAPLKKELKVVLSYMDQLLESLPDNKIEEFARSEHYDTYKKLFKELGLV